MKDSCGHFTSNDQQTIVMLQEAHKPLQFQKEGTLSYEVEVPTERGMYSGDAVLGGKDVSAVDSLAVKLVLEMQSALDMQ